MIFPGFPGVPSFFQVFQVEWEPWSYQTVIKHAAELHVPRAQRTVFLLSLPAVNGYSCLITSQLETIVLKDSGLNTKQQKENMLFALSSQQLHNGWYLIIMQRSLSGTLK